MKISLMTINIFLLIKLEYERTKNIEKAKAEYEELFQNIEKAGFTAVDINMFEIKLFGEDYILNLLKKHKLHVSSYIHIGAFASMSNNADIVIEDGKAAVLQAQRLGTDTLMLVPIAPDNITNYTKNDIADYFAATLKPIIHYASKQNIYVSIEDTPDLNLPFCTTDEIKYILNKADGLRFAYDTCNMILAHEDPVKYFDTFASKCIHIHLKDIRKSYPEDLFKDTDIDGTFMSCAKTGTGIVDFKTILQHVKDSGYDRYMSIECAASDGNQLEDLINCKKYFEALM